MGYSCTKAAIETLNMIAHVFDSKKGQSTMLIKGQEYFFERGQENEDGAITGTLMLMLGNSLCRKAGSVRIEPDGAITRFPGLSSADKQEVLDSLADVRARNPRLFSQIMYHAAL